MGSPWDRIGKVSGLTSTVATPGSSLKRAMHLSLLQDTRGLNTLEGAARGRIDCAET